jgi:hypothetical protein
MICAPALLIEGLLVRGGENAAITGIASMIFMAGWICTNTGMRRMQAAGTGTLGRTILLVQLAGLVLAFLFGFFEATGLLGRDSIIFNVTDAAWPLSMLWMLVVGISVIVAKRLDGWQTVHPDPVPVLVADRDPRLDGPRRHGGGLPRLRLRRPSLGLARLHRPRRSGERRRDARTRRSVGA